MNQGDIRVIPLLEERLATLESEVQHIEKEVTKIDDVNSKLDAMLLEHSRYKGFLGGIVFVATCIMAFFKGLPLISTLLWHK